MRSSFGHFGDVVEAVKEIYEGTRERKTKTRLIEFMDRLVQLEGDYANLDGFWPGFTQLRPRGAR
ncbi:MAG: hypothetical protein ABSG17_11255 [Spirochaetia bacterium]|jgi:hypothetical protein